MRGNCSSAIWEDTPVMVLSGRAHYYEGHPMTQVTFAVRALAAYGIRDLLLTNAAGGINRRFRPGDFMVLDGPHQPDGDQSRCEGRPCRACRALWI